MPNTSSTDPVKEFTDEAFLALLDNESMSESEMDILLKQLQEDPILFEKLRSQQKVIDSLNGEPTPYLNVDLTGSIRQQIDAEVETECVKKVYFLNRIISNFYLFFSQFKIPVNSLAISFSVALAMIFTISLIVSNHDDSLSVAVNEKDQQSLNTNMLVQQKELSVEKILAGYELESSDVDIQAEFKGTRSIKNQQLELYHLLYLNMQDGEMLFPANFARSLSDQSER